MKQLLHGDILLPDFSVLQSGYIGIHNETIAFVGEREPEGFGTPRRYAGHLFMPGLFNLHTHTSMVLLRGLGSDLPLDRWLNEAMFPIEAKLTPPDIDVGTRIAMMEMLACGTVSFTDMYDMPRVTMERVAEAGMKANLNRPILAFDKTEPYDKNFRVDEALAFFLDCHGAAGGRIKVDFGIHAEYTSYDDVVRLHGEDCKKRGAIMHLHLSETKKEHDECKQRHGKTPARWFCDLGVFDNPTVAAHCVMCEPEDIAILREKNVTAVHNPSSNMKLGSGFMPIQPMLDSRVNLAIGTDGAASNNNLNLFEEMHVASIIHNGKTNDPTIVKPRELLTMATANGAAAQGRTDCGAIAVGNRADIIAINLNKPHLMPVHDIPALLVYSVQGADVAMTMVDGKILYKNGEFKTIDAEKVRFDLRQTLKQLFG